MSITIPDNGSNYEQVRMMYNVYVFDDSSYSYVYGENNDDYPDIDNDGFNELIVRRSPFPFVPPYPVEILVFQTQGVSTSVNGGTSQVPRIMQLKQNYPNPFNPTT